jgi:phenylalanyl-tRNA synthetase alpha chain
MNYTIDDVLRAHESLLSQKATKTATQLLKSAEFSALFDVLKGLPADEKSLYGKEVNALRMEVQSWAEDAETTEVTTIDITAPWDTNTPADKRPRLLPAENGTMHPLTTELNYLSDIFYRMGFLYEPSRELDDDWHMFGSLNFPEGHPARDDWDTFMTDEGLIAPAHTSTMQNRVMQKYRSNLEKGEAIAVHIIDRAFRNEDLDITHEHTFHQIEGIYVDKGVHVGNLVAVIKGFMTEYFERELDVKIQPFYFPFTEPSFEFAITRPESMRKDGTEAEKWLEIGGCGMIHPNVLRDAGIDPEVYTGFAWGFGLERMVMMKHGIEDIRHFNSAKIEFLRQFGDAR